MYHESYRIARGKPRWADKTTDYTRVLPEIEEMFGPDAQYVMIFRHPFEVVYSTYARGLRLGNFHPDLLINSAMHVDDMMKKQLAFAGAHPDRCYRLYYEHLVQAPEEVLRPMIEFLGEPWEPSILQFHTFDHNFGTEDPVVKGMQGFSLNWGGFHALKPEQVTTIRPLVQEVSTALGYSLTDLSVPSLKSGPEAQFVGKAGVVLHPQSFDQVHGHRAALSN